MAQYETPHWTGPPPRPERDTFSEIAGWLARYAFLFLMIFFVLLVVAAMAFLPSLRGDDVVPVNPNPNGLSGNVDSVVPVAPVPTGYTMLNVATNPAGALVQIDIDSVGTTPLYRRELERKVHLLSIVKPGYARIDTVLFADDLRNDSSFFFFVLTPTGSNGSQATRPRLASNDGNDAPPVQRPPQTTQSLPERQTPAADVSRDTQPVTEPVTQPVVTTPEPEVARVPEQGSLAVTSSPAGATVSVDGRVAGVTPLDMSGLDPGEHVVRFSMNGYVDKESSVTIRPGIQSSVETSLVAASGTLVVLAKPYGTIFVDGVLVKRDVDVEYETSLSQGPHVIVVSHRVLGSLTHNVVIGSTPKSIIFDFNNMNVTSN